MEFKVSKITGKWYDENNNEFSLDTNTNQGLLIEKWLLEGNEPMVFDGTEEELQQEVEKEKILLKQKAYEELLLTDWYVVRFVETGIHVPEEILQQRQAIREKCK